MLEICWSYFLHVKKCEFKVKIKIFFWKETKVFQKYNPKKPHKIQFNHESTKVQNKLESSEKMLKCIAIHSTKSMNSITAPVSSHTTARSPLAQRLAKLGVLRRSSCSTNQKQLWYPYYKNPQNTQNRIFRHNQHNQRSCCLLYISVLKFVIKIIKNA